VWTVPGCHKPTPAPSSDNSSREPESQSFEGTPTGPKEIPSRVNIAVHADDSDRWLVVEKVKDGAAGAWATGSFDSKRNKLDISTHDVTQFAIDTARIPIRWDKLVIIRIDGRNSELVRRDYTVLHFIRDKYGWHVIEP
jgi:hypothetical protein